MMPGLPAPWDPKPLKPCDNPACDHQTSTGSMFCCRGCDQANGRYDPEGYHSADCMERHAERGPAQRPR